MIYIDSHVHLDDEIYNNDRKEVLSRAIENDVKLIGAVSCVSKVGDADLTLELLENDFIYGIFGIHPHDARFYSNELKKYLKEIMKHPKVIAIGEIGLDYHYEYSSKDEQIRAFEDQIVLAQEFRKPIVVHSREARKDTLDILKKNYQKEEYRVNGIMHCFSGDINFAEECISLGFYISFSGVITFDNATRIKEVLKKVPLEHILSETDSPYLSPAPYRGKRNEPAYVIRVVNKISEVKEKPVQQIADTIYLNMQRIINK